MGRARPFFVAGPVSLTVGRHAAAFDDAMWKRFIELNWPTADGA